MGRHFVELTCIEIGNALPSFIECFKKHLIEFKNCFCYINRTFISIILDTIKLKNIDYMYNNRYIFIVFYYFINFIKSNI